MDYGICVNDSQSWHLHKADIPLQNAQKNVFCNGISHLCNLKQELPLTQIGFPIAKHLKKRVLLWIIAFA